MGTLVLGLGTAAVAGTGALLASCVRLRSAVGFLLATYLLASAEVVASAFLLSTGRWLGRGSLLVAIAGLLAAAAVLWMGSGRPRPPIGLDTLRAFRNALRDPAVATLACLAVIAHAYLLAGALTVPQSTWDALLYHLPRAALWKQQHAVAYVANASDERINVFPPNAEIESMASMILSNGDRYVSVVQLLALLFTCVAIVGVSRRIGLSRSVGVFGALAYSTFTVVALQTPTALNDLVVASALMICAYFATGSSRRELALAALALGLGLGTKLTAVFALPALALFVLASQPRRRWPSLALFGTAGVALGSPWLWVNLAETGRFDGNVVLDRGGDGVLERIRLSVVDLLELSDAESKGLLQSPLWGAAAFALALAAAAVLVARKKTQAGGVTFLVGVIAFLVLPMLSIWTQVANRAFGQARAAIGLAATASGSGVPDRLYESPMHSSYGIAFVLLLVGVGALVVVEVVRRKLSISALAALGSVPLTLLVLALLLSYDPQHMRYIAFAAALASAVFGVALRVRPLAWTAVGMTAVTLAITLAYFAPRPGGFTLLPGHRDADRTARWFVQGGERSSKGDPEAFRFLELDVPTDAMLALDVVRDTYLYPAWDAGLRRTILFVPEGGPVPREARWLVIGPGKQVDLAPLERSGWHLALATSRGWRILRR